MGKKINKQLSTKREAEEDIGKFYYELCDIKKEKINAWFKFFGIFSVLFLNVSF